MAVFTEDYGTEIPLELRDPALGRECFGNGGKVRYSDEERAVLCKRRSVIRSSI